MLKNNRFSKEYIKFTLVILIILSILFLYQSTLKNKNVDALSVNQDSPEQLISTYAINLVNFYNFKLSPKEFVKIYDQVNLHSFDSIIFAGYIDLEGGKSEELRGSQVRNLNSDKFYKQVLKINKKMNFYTSSNKSTSKIYVSKLLKDINNQNTINMYEIRKDINNDIHFITYKFTFILKNNKYFISNAIISDIPQAIDFKNELKSENINSLLEIVQMYKSHDMSTIEYHLLDQ